MRENTEDLYAGVEFEPATRKPAELIEVIKTHLGQTATAETGVTIKPISVSGTDAM